MAQASDLLRKQLACALHTVSAVEHVLEKGAFQNHSEYMERLASTQPTMELSDMTVDTMRIELKKTLRKFSIAINVLHSDLYDKWDKYQIKLRLARFAP